MFDVNTIILHKLEAHGRLRRVTGTLQKTLQSLGGAPMEPKSHGKFPRNLGMQGGVAMLNLEYVSMRKLEI